MPLDGAERAKAATFIPSPLACMAHTRRRAIPNWRRIKENQCPERRRHPRARGVSRATKTVSNEFERCSTTYKTARLPRRARTSLGYANLARGFEGGRTKNRGKGVSANSRIRSHGRVASVERYCISCTSVLCNHDTRKHQRLSATWQIQQKCSQHERPAGLACDISDQSLQSRLDAMATCGGAGQVKFFVTQICFITYTQTRTHSLLHAVEEQCLSLR